MGGERITTTVRMSKPVQVARFCDHCASGFQFTKTIEVTGRGVSRGPVGMASSSVATGYAQDAAYLNFPAEIQKLRESTMDGVLCPRCGNFIKAARDVHFPHGERIGVTRKIAEHRRLSVFCLWSGLALLVIAFILICTSPTRTTRLGLLIFLRVVLPIVGVLLFVIGIRMFLAVPKMLRGINRLADTQLHSLIVQNYYDQGESLNGEAWARVLKRLSSA